MSAAENKQLLQQIFSELAKGNSNRPAGYPNSNLPAHIHIEIAVPGDEPRTFISEILFADDPRLTNEVRERSLREGLVIFPVTRSTNGEWRVQADFQAK